MRHLENWVVASLFWSQINIKGACYLIHDNTRERTDVSLGVSWLLSRTKGGFEVIIYPYGIMMVKSAYPHV